MEIQYLNHRKVHFHGSEASQSDREEASSPIEEEDKSGKEESESEDNSKSEEENFHSEPGSNTTQIDAYLQSVEESIHSAIEKFTSKT